MCKISRVFEHVKGPKSGKKAKKKITNKKKKKKKIILTKTIGPSPFQGLGPNNNPNENNRAFALSGLGP